MRSGRYVVYGEIASGGMATVHIGRFLGPAGFARTVAVKRLHKTYARDPAFVAMLLDEARLAARISHPNVVPILDVVAAEGELLLIMEYVQGDSLACLVRACAEAKVLIPPPIAANIIAGVLHGLHAAHEATAGGGSHLEIVHRDVSPQNILVGADGVARVIDFGIAKALGRSQSTAEGVLKGKLGYMAPEQLQGRATRRSDVYSTSVVFWEALTGRRLFDGSDQGGILAQILDGRVRRPSEVVSGISSPLEEVLMRGLARDETERFATAREMALALEEAEAVVPTSAVGAWVAQLAQATLAARAELVHEIETSLGAPPTSERASQVVRAAARTSMEGAARTSMEGAATVTMVVPITRDPITPLASKTEVDVVPVGRPAASRVRARVLWALLLVAAATVPLVAVTRPSTTRATPAASSPPQPSTQEREVVPPPIASASSAPPGDAVPSPIAAASASVPRPRSRPSCVPPYREILIDGHVRRVLKPECL